MNKGSVGSSKRERGVQHLDQPDLYLIMSQEDYNRVEWDYKAIRAEQ